MAKAARSV
jgi:hypothetical protein